MKEAISSSGQIRRLPLHDIHLKLGAKIGQFGQWEVPLYYSSILQEHDAVRARAGLFDISHMGEFFIKGAGAARFLQDLLPRDVEKMEQGKALYMPLLKETGGIVDDIILYRLKSDAFLMIVNAANVEKDFQFIRSNQNAWQKHAKEALESVNATDDFGLLALQGPASQAILEKALGQSFADLAYYHIRETSDGFISRTGYTGEDGFELMLAQDKLPAMWKRLFEAGADAGLVPAGFGARDTLRLEAAMPLYGHDMNEETTPFEVGIGWAVDLKKTAFVGRDALLEQKGKGIQRKLIGFEMTGRGIPRDGYEILSGERKVGKVTSGCFAPTLKKNIGLGFVIPECADAGSMIEIMIRDAAVRARVVKLPFYKRKKAEAL